MATYWIADSKGRVLGPVTLAVLKDLAGNGRVNETTQVSTDGHGWLPALQVPEVHALLRSGAVARMGAEDAELQKAARLREQLEQLKSRLPHEIFQVSANATLEQHRTAFFALVKRFHPARLPAEAHPELRNACREAFEFLAGVMATVEKSIPPTSPVMRAVAPPAQRAPLPRPAPLAPAPARYRLEDFVGFSDGRDVVEARMRITPLNAGIFTDHMVANLSSGGVFLPSDRRLPLGTLLDLCFLFEAPERQVTARGKVIWENAGASKKNINGVGVRFLRMDDEDKQFIQGFLKAIPAKERQVLRF